MTRALNAPLVLAQRRIGGFSSSQEAGTVTDDYAIRTEDDQDWLMEDGLTVIRTEDAP